ncbi:MAG: hypothetical protein ABFD80_05040 [Acidobacteriota bacterium]
MTIPHTSIYEPLTVTIDGATYAVKRLNRQRFRELAKLQEKAATATQEEMIDIGYDEIALLIDAPKDVVDGLDVSQIRSITRWLTQALFGAGAPAKAAEDTEKNGRRPGDETPQG